ncbi:hypothetical protein GC089_13945 [Cellulomonas sp. JZ18]|uniref:hypothetical protein n=1 Tax=Cellulomonas sp. JZ18 TaxID=2654191 RepID=UPI0012D4A41A|nr:hypothetical protein [Cellulomonas sp. JZ18]QGQ20107.1 hypothetical protein GC089_13945 [Cellulomonas sp. JZ18]
MSGAVHGVLLAAVVHAERLPGPTIESPEEGSPGFLGFVVTFLLAAAVIALAVSFSRRMRRADHRARLRAQEEEQRGAAAGPAPVTAEEAVAQTELDARTEAGRPAAPAPDASADGDADDGGGQDTPGRDVPRAP